MSNIIRQMRNHQPKREERYWLEVERVLMNEGYSAGEIESMSDTMAEELYAQIKSKDTHGTGPGEWSDRKAQLLARLYKAEGGGYKS